MMSVDVIGDIRRAYFEQRLPIKEIVRTLRVSRATVRKVVRSHKTAFKYERGVQPAPKLGAWVEVLAQILEKEAKLPRRERRSTQRLFEELCEAAVTMARMTACIVSPNRGATSRLGRRRTPLCGVPRPAWARSPRRWCSNSASRICSASAFFSASSSPSLANTACGSSPDSSSSMISSRIVIRPPRPSGATV